MKALFVILKPIITEKATLLGSKHTYGFYINPRSTKVDVKMAIKEMYGEDVETVRIMITPAKKRSLGRKTINKKHEMKKAFITLKGKKKLDITKFGKEDAGSASEAKVKKTAEAGTAKKKTVATAATATKKTPKAASAKKESSPSPAKS